MGRGIKKQLIFDTLFLLISGVSFIKRLIWEDRIKILFITCM